MSERIEYKKTIVFDSAESRMLYDAITAFESRNKGITQSAFVNDFIKSAFLPDYPIAKGFCERLYLIDHTGESVFDILSDLFLFLAEKTNIERFTILISSIFN